jgi:hypothetical protein
MKKNEKKHVLQFKFFFFYYFFIIGPLALYFKDDLQILRR